MGLNVSNKPKAAGSSNRVPQANLKIGSHAARLVQIIDLGLQPQRPYKGTEKAPVDMLYVTYELSHEFMIDAKGEPDPSLPRWISEDFAAYSLEADKAKSTLRYNVLDPVGEHGGDFSKLLGAPCSVVVVHNKGHGANADKVYDNVGDVVPAISVPGYVQPAIVNTPLAFDLSSPDLEAFNKLPKFLQDRIKGNLNYNGSPLQKLLGGAEAAPATESNNTEEEENPY